MLIYILINVFLATVFMAKKPGRMLASTHEVTQSFGQLVLQDQVTNENHISTKTVPMATKSGFIFTCSHCSCTILPQLDTLCKHKVMLIHILINIQHLQNIIFSFKIGSIGKNISSSDYQHSMRKSLQQNLLFPATC